MLRWRREGYPCSLIRPLVRQSIQTMIYMHGVFFCDVGIYDDIFFIHFLVYQVTKILSVIPVIMKMRYDYTPFPYFYALSMTPFLSFLSFELDIYYYYNLFHALSLTLLLSHSIIVFLSYRTFSFIYNSSRWTICKNYFPQKKIANWTIS